MGQPNIPAAPSAPDYGAATREGVYADIDTLDTRRQIENAARLGKSVQIYNPTTGEFEVKDFTGLGDAEYARQAAQLATEQNETVQRQQLALRRELGTANAAQTRAELEASDPTAFRARDALTRKLENDMAVPDGDMVVAPSGNVRAGATALANLAYAAPDADGRVNTLYDQAGNDLRSSASDLGTLGQLQGLQAATAGDNAARNTLGALQGQAGQDMSPAAMAALQAQAATDPGARAQYQAMLAAASKDPTPANLALLQNAAATDPGARSQYASLLSSAAQDNTAGQLGALRTAAANDPGARARYDALSAGAAADDTASQLGALRTAAANDPGARPQYASLSAGAASDGTARQLAALQAAAATDPGARARYDALLQQSATSASRGKLGSIYDEATRLPSTVSDPTSATLNAGLQGALADYQLGGKLDDSTKRDLLNDVRAGQVARGNYLGDAAAVVEATELGSAAEQRKAQRLQAVLAAQSQAFGQNSSLRDQETAMRNTRLGALTNLQAQDFSQDTTLRAEQANLAGLSAAELQQLRAEQAGYGTTAASLNSQLRSEQANLAGLSAAELQQRRAEQAGYTSAAGDRRAATRAEQANLAGLSAAEQQQLRAEQAGYSLDAAGIGSQLRGEQANLAGMSAAEIRALRAEQAGYGTTAADINSRLRGEQADYAGLSAGEIQRLRAEQAGYADTGADRTAALRAEPAGSATGAQGINAQQTATLAALAQQIYGTGSAMRGENLAANQARLGTLAQLAGQDNNQRQQAYTSRLAAMGQAQQGNLNIAAEERAARGETIGRNQQKLANVSAMVLGQPITNQFGSLAGAQQGAVGFTPINYQGGTNLNQNAGQAGASFAQGNFGTNSSNWNTSAGIAAQGNPWMSLLGQGLGAAAGAGGAKLGAMI